MPRTKKLFTVLLALALAAALLAVGALAAQPDYAAQIVDADGNVLSDGDGNLLQYDTLDAAIAYAVGSDSGDSVIIEVLGNCRIDTRISVPGGKSITIFSDSDDLTITDDTRKGINLSANGSLAFEGITFDTNGQIYLYNEASLTFTNAELNMDGEMYEFSIAYYCCAISLEAPANLTFDNSEVYIANYPLQGSAIRWDNNSEGYYINIINGTNFESTNCYAGFTGTCNVLIENSKVNVHDHRGNGANGSHFIIRTTDEALETETKDDDTVVDFNNNGSHGLSAGELNITNSTVTCNNNHGMGITVNDAFTVVNSEVTVEGNADNKSYGYAAVRLYNNYQFSVDSTSKLYIRNNNNTGLYVRQGNLNVADGAVLEITGNKVTHNLLGGYGGGLYVGYPGNSGVSVTLPADAVIYNNHSLNGGDDIYVSQEDVATLTFGTVGTNWYLDGGPDCYHLIDVWYDDSEGTRWKAHEDDPQDNHVVEFDAFGQDTGLATVSGVTALKAAHGLLGADADTVVINPADITIYTGGDGYDSVVSDVGDSGVASDGLPTAGYLITLPDWVDALYFNGASEAADLSGSVRFVLDYEGDGAYTTENDRIWELERYSDSGTSTTSDAVARYVYRMEADKVNGVPVRLQFEDEDGNITISDDFTIGLDNLYQSYEMTIYPGNLERGNIKAQIIVGGNIVQTLNVEVGTADLTVRGTTNAEVTTGVVSDESDVADTTQAVSDGTGCTVTAVAPAGTAYYINNSLVSVDPDNVSLLTDAVVDAAVLQDYIIENDIAGSGDNYVYRYLDLVDGTNGRTWITATNPIAVYWKLPNGTDGTEDFRIVHFQGLDREYDNHDEQLAENEPEVYSIGSGLEVVEIDGEKYLKFSVGSFSPFVLVWSGGDTPVKPVDPEKPGGLNTEDHVAYIIGYPDGEVKPEGNITRAEVATIFFRLLTDETRSEYWSKTNGYTDVSAESWYNNAISTLSNMGIIDGYPDGSFRPNAPITRAEFTKIAVSFFEYADYEYRNTFPDVHAGSWYTQFVAAAVELGLIEGYPDGTFRPDASITRAEACTIVNRTLGRAPDEEHLLPVNVMITWPDNLPGYWYYADMQEATNSHDYEWLGAIEDWTAKLEERDWAELEKMWSEANDAPGGEVMG